MPWYTVTIFYTQQFANEEEAFAHGHGQAAELPHGRVDSVEVEDDDVSAEQPNPTLTRIESPDKAETLARTEAIIRAQFAKIRADLLPQTAEQP